MSQSPDELVFRNHVKNGAFESGVDRGRWQLVSIDWPFAIIKITAAPREGAPSQYAFRFELSNYPESAPTAQPWSVEAGEALAFKNWPGGTNRIRYAFNPGWKDGSCLYLPCDRQAIEGHEQWRNQHPEMIWSSVGDITQYIHIIYDLLHSKDYSGVRGS
jgi:hypothetical protein